MKNKEEFSGAIKTSSELLLQQITTAASEKLPAIRVIYENSFPAAERRRFQQLLHMLQEPNMQLHALLKAGSLVGMAVHWQLGKLLFLEHLAIAPNHRNRGYGKAFMQWLLQQPHHRLVLEVEPPTDDVTRKRIQFYEALGLSLLPYPYQQPPYERQGHPLPLRLMSQPAIVTPAEYKRTATLIREQVYEQFYF